MKNLKIVHLKLINFDDVTGENIKEHDPNWPQIAGHLYRILIGGSGLGKTNALYFVKPSTRYLWNVLMHKRSIWSRISVVN